MSRVRGTPPGSRAGSLGLILCLRAFQVFAIAEGGLLPAILLIAVIHWTSGRADTLVAVVGATHGTVFTLYVVMVAPVARVLGWSPRTASVAVSVAFVPFATWVFESSVRAEIARRLAESRVCRSPDRSDLVHDDSGDHGRPEDDDQQEGPTPGP